MVPVILISSKAENWYMY